MDKQLDQVTDPHESRWEDNDQRREVVERNDQDQEVVKPRQGNDQHQEVVGPREDEEVVGPREDKVVKPREDYDRDQKVVEPQSKDNDRNQEVVENREDRDQEISNLREEVVELIEEVDYYESEISILQDLSVQQAILLGAVGSFYRSETDMHQNGKDIPQKIQKLTGELEVLLRDRRAHGERLGEITNNIAHLTEQIQQIIGREPEPAESPVDHREETKSRDGDLQHLANNNQATDSYYGDTTESEISPNFKDFGGNLLNTSQDKDLKPAAKLLTDDWPWVKKLDEDIRELDLRNSYYRQRLYLRSEECDELEKRINTIRRINLRLMAKCNNNLSDENSMLVRRREYTDIHEEELTETRLLNDQLRREVKEQVRDMTVLRREIHRLHVENEELEAENARIESERVQDQSMLQIENDQLQEENDRLQAENSRIESVLENENERLHLEIERLQAEKASLESERLQDEILQQTENGRLQAKNSRVGSVLQSEMERRHKENIRLPVQNARIEREQFENENLSQAGEEGLRFQLETEVSGFSNKARENKRLHFEIERLRAENAGFAHEEPMAAKENFLLHQEIERLQAENARIKSKRHDKNLQSENGRLRVEIEHLKAKNARVKSKRLEDENLLQSENERLCIKIERLQTENARLKGEMPDTARENIVLRSEMEHLQNEIDFEEVPLAARENFLLHQRIERLHAENERLQEATSRSYPAEDDRVVKEEPQPDEPAPAAVAPVATGRQRTPRRRRQPDNFNTVATRRSKRLKTKGTE